LAAKPSGRESTASSKRFRAGPSRALDERIHATVADLEGNGEQVRYAGSLLMPTDEVVLFLFEGPEDLVRLSARRAGVPFERIVPATSDQISTTLAGGEAP